MKGEETLRALLAGKTLVSEVGTPYRLSDGRLIHRLVGVKDKVGDFEIDFSDVWTFAESSFNSIMDREFTVYEEEYPLTFKEALKEMLDGKVVGCEIDPHCIWRITEKGFEYQTEGVTWKRVLLIYPYEQKGKWRVVQ